MPNKTNDTCQLRFKDLIILIPVFCNDSIKGVSSHSVPIQVELCVKHTEIILIAHFGSITCIHAHIFLSKMLNIIIFLRSIASLPGQMIFVAEKRVRSRCFDLKSWRKILFYSIHECFCLRPFSGQSNSLQGIGCKDIIDMRGHVAH